MSALVLALLGATALDRQLGVPAGTCHYYQGTVHHLVLRRLREEAGYSQQEVADMFGRRTPKFVEDYETGRWRLRPASLARLAEILEVPPDVLWRFPVPDARVGHLPGWRETRVAEIRSWFAGELAAGPQPATVKYVGAAELAHYMRVNPATLRKWWERYHDAGFPAPDITILAQRGQVVPGWVPKRRPEIRRWVTEDRLAKPMSDKDLLAHRANGVTWPKLAEMAEMSLPGVRHRHHRLVASKANQTRRAVARATARATEGT